MLTAARNTLLARHRQAITAPRSTAAARSRLLITMAAKPAIHLYSLATPNGQKAGIVLEELGLEYETTTINIIKGDQFTPEFKAINPNSKIPALVDHDGPGGKPITVFESGAILLYLAEKTGKLLPKDPIKKWETIEWLMWQMGGVGPMFGQFNHFSKFAPERIEYGVQRYGKETKRLLTVLEKQLEGKQYVIGDEYTVADISLYAWVKAIMDTPLEKLKEVEIVADDFPNIKAWLARLGERPGVQRGVKVGSLSK